jgi:hypothetical protein
VIVQNERPFRIPDFEICEVAAVSGRYALCHVVLLR